MRTRSIVNRTKTTSTTNSNAAAPTANPGEPIPARGNRLTAVATTESGERTNLLVVPPGTRSATVRAAMGRAADPANRLTASAILSAQSILRHQAHDEHIGLADDDDIGGSADIERTQRSADDTLTGVVE